MKNLVRVIGLALVVSLAGAVGCSSYSSSEITINGVKTCSISVSNKSLSDVAAMFSEKVDKPIVLADGVDGSQSVTEREDGKTWETCMEKLMSKLDLKVEFDQDKDEFRIVKSS